MRVVFPAPKNPVMIVKGVLASSFVDDCSAMAAAWCAGVALRYLYRWALLIDGEARALSLPSQV